MTIFKKAGFLSHLAKCRLGINKAPISVIFNITNRCNLRCRYCYASYPDRVEVSEMTTDETKSLMIDLYKSGCRRISFSGGEPLLRSDIDELIECCKNMGFFCTVNTNGILVPSKINILKKIDTLAISLDGQEENHDILRGKGTAKKVLKAIEIAVNAGIKVHTNTVLHKYNIDDIDYMLNLAKKIGFKTEFNIMISNVFIDENNKSDFKASDSQYKRAIQYLIDKKKQGEPILFSAYAYKSVLKYWDSFETEFSTDVKKIPVCPAGKFFCMIDTDGKLWACPHLIGKINASNALKDGIKRAWQKANNHECKGCYQVYHHEFALLMQLNPFVLYNYAKLK